MTELVVFAYEGRDVAFDPSARMWNLTAMHRAAGSVPHKAPAQWLRGVQAGELLAVLVEEETVGNSHSFVETREGRAGGTWAYWQIAAAYAHYLSPRFYLQWNRWALERYQQGIDQSSSLGLRVGQLEAQMAALSAQMGALTTTKAAIRATPQKRKKRRQASLPGTAVKILAAIKELGGRASPSEIQARLPHMPSSTIRVRLQRLRDDGVLRQPHTGMYELIES